MVVLLVGCMGSPEIGQDDDTALADSASEGCEGCPDGWCWELRPYIGDPETCEPLQVGAPRFACAEPERMLEEDYAFEVCSDAIGWTPPDACSGNCLVRAAR